MRSLVLAGAATIALAACAADPGPRVVFDPCQPLALDTTGLGADQAASVADAIALWRARDLAAPTVDAVPGAARVPVVFQDAAPAFHGYYDDRAAVIYVNTDLDDPSMRAVTIAHELGHAFGLPHVAPDVRLSVMNPDNLTVEPTGADGAAIVALWGACPE